MSVTIDQILTDPSNSEFVIVCRDLVIESLLSYEDFEGSSEKKNCQLIGGIYCTENIREFLTSRFQNKMTRSDIDRYTGVRPSAHLGHRVISRFGSAKLSFLAECFMVCRSKNIQHLREHTNIFDYFMSNGKSKVITSQKFGISDKDTYHHVDYICVFLILNCDIKV